jgi:beta-lactamase regulating signal transducer with metallopeptidase domain
MTIEFSLRTRAKRARYMAAFWLAVTTLILLGTYVSLPFVANRTLSAVHADAESSELNAPITRSAVDSRTPRIELYTIGVLALGLLAVCFACFLLGRAAFVEIELAARFAAFADALCLAGENFDQLERAANLLLPGSKYLSVPEIFSTKDLDSVADLLKALRPK